MAITADLRVRHPHIELPDDFDPRWNPRAPEFVAAANSVSLLMPYIEPYFVRATRAVLADPDVVLGPELRSSAEAYAAQEAAHHREHRRFNELIRRRYRHVAGLERGMRAVYAWLWRSRTLEFSLAFAAASECIAYTIARWSAAHYRDLLAGSTPVAHDLFVWHLAEEVEHKSVAFDLDRAYRHSRWRYIGAALVSLGILAVFAASATLVMLAHDRRLHHPGTWWRLLRWALSFWFSLAPALAVSSTNGHHPSQLSDPSFYAAWLRSHDGIVPD